MVYYAKGIKLNGKISENWSNLLFSLSAFVFFSSKTFSKNVSLLQKLKNKILSCIFLMKKISSVFDETNLVVYRNENA